MRTRLPTMPGSAAADDRVRQRRMAAAAVIGTTVEWYDFYLYASMASIVFGTVFFPSGDSKIATLQSFATFAVGFLARPLSGVIFGALGDSIGRKKVLVLTFVLMGVSTALIGLLPGYAQIGVWAPVLLVVLRIVQGIGAGAEFASASVASYEHADTGRRGIMGSWPAVGMNLGLLLASATTALLGAFGDDFLVSVGWRIPFIASLALVAVGIWVRSALPETPQYAAEKGGGLDAAHGRSTTRRGITFSLVEVFRRDWRGLLVVMFVCLGYSSVSYTFKTFSLAYLTEYQGVSASTSSLGVTFAGMVAIIVIPFFGRACDRWSSKWVLRIGGILSGLWAFAFLPLLATGEKWSVWIALIVGTGLVVPMMFAAQGAFFSRQFPVSTRSSGVGTARELGTAIAGGGAPMLALALVTWSSDHSTTGVTVLLVAAALVVVVTTFGDQGRKISAEKN